MKVDIRQHRIEVDMTRHCWRHALLGSKGEDTGHTNSVNNGNNGPTLAS